MKILDIVILTGIVSIACCLIVIPNRTIKILRPALWVILLLVILQLITEGYYWHYLPSYVLLGTMLLMLILFKESTGKTIRKLLQITLGIIILAAIFPWTVFLPIPKLTPPTGNYKVGTRIFRWVDMDRSEKITPDIGDKRNVIVQAWYPVEGNINGNHSGYIDGLGNLPAKIGMLPGFIFDHYDKVETNGLLNAPILNKETSWPVIIFLTGNAASRAFYTSIVTGLASHGYIVLAIDHPYEAMITQLADGKLATTIEVHLDDDPDLTKFMKDRIDTRIADVNFVINQIENLKGSATPFFSSIDKNRIVIAGHSLGGATAAVAMAGDLRIKAAANIDGTLYGQVPKTTGPRPFLLIESNKDKSDRYERYENGNRQFFNQFGGGYRYQIVEADHYSFTDGPLLLAFPSRFVASHLLEFGNIPTRTHHTTVKILHTFFNSVFTSDFSKLDSIGHSYNVISQYKVTPPRFYDIICI
jgi:dienelactone hydrolase